MLGILIVAHGALAKEFITVSEHVVGQQPYLEAIGVLIDEPMEDCRERIMEAVKRINQGHGVIILTDMFGGTPSNLSISVMGIEAVEVVAGVNLPMLIKLLSVRESQTLQEASLSVQEAGRKYINIASALLKKNAT